MTRRTGPVKPPPPETEDAPEKWTTRSYNRMVTHVGVDRGTPSANYQTLTACRKKVDEYFNTAEWPTISGLALALSYKSIREYEEAMHDAYNKSIEFPKEGEWRAMYEVLEKARTRIIMHYEEGIQSGHIPAQVGKYVLEVLGIQPPQVTTKEEATSRTAADAARKGYANALKDAKQIGKVAARAIGNDL